MVRHMSMTTKICNMSPLSTPHLKHQSEVQGKILRIVTGHLHHQDRMLARIECW